MNDCIDCPDYSAHQSYLFFFNDPATSEIYTLSLHDALPILSDRRSIGSVTGGEYNEASPSQPHGLLRTSHCFRQDRKSTRLNSSHVSISYAVFCLKKKKKNQ